MPSAFSAAPHASCDAGACPLAGHAVPLAGAAVDRRVFLSRAVLAAAAVALAACGSSGGDNVTGPSIGSTISLATYPNLAAVGGVQTATYNGTPVAIVRTGTSSFITLSLRCPHQRTTLDVTSGGFQCPNHGATFNSTGQWVGGQPTSSMTAYPTTYDAATGTLTIG